MAVDTIPQMRDLPLVECCTPLAGSTLPHSHAQLFALPFVPTEVARERERFTAYHERTMGSHLLEDVLVEEVRRRERLIAIDDEAALICPWASRSPYEMRLVPRSAAPRFVRLISSSTSGVASTSSISSWRSPWP